MEGEPRGRLHIMELVIAATEKEMTAFDAVDNIDKPLLDQLVSGVGPVETAFTVGRYLERHHRKIRSVVNFGIGGAYLAGGLNPASLLDICLAAREVLGDFGISFGVDTEPFDEVDFPIRSSFELDKELLKVAAAALAAESIEAHVTTFVTVSAASGTRERGEQLGKRYQALCENMEGAAVARVCEAYDIPLLEVRAISNLVENRPGSPWKIDAACSRAARAASVIIRALHNQ